MQLWQEGHRPQLTKFRWNSQNQLTGVQTPGGQQWDYRYDAFGRRTEKVCERAGLRTTYLWDGDVPAEIREYRHNRLYSIRHLVFDGWQLLAQQVQFFTLNPENRHELLAGEIQTQYAVCAPTGEPLALFDEAGHRVWRQPPHSLYGLCLGVLGENPELNPGLKFAGQWLDEESGLVYNRFRYYSPVASCYLTPDPIGLHGGLNLYAYVKNPTSWVDPLGLSSLNAFELAQRKARETRELCKTNGIRRPTATTVVKNVRTGDVFYGFSGTKPQNISARLGVEMPLKSLEPWSVNNCGEIDAVNKALKKGSSLHDLEMATVRTGDGSAFPKCKNCIYTFKRLGIKVLTG
ncbi:RHS family protein [Xenorhabdus miraniensis]|uniref:RHS family protein n=2 Tax=Xenorhabdus miraniensis TaxID=351674 RepID=A0A2D0JKE2_9GAMM|nr:RHS family protein [Xenorhabdus miraniensis]